MVLSGDVISHESSGERDGCGGSRFMCVCSVVSFGLV